MGTIIKGFCSAFFVAITPVFIVDRFRDLFVRNSIKIRMLRELGPFVMSMTGVILILREAGIHRDARHVAIGCAAAYFGVVFILYLALLYQFHYLLYHGNDVDPERRGSTLERNESENGWTPGTNRGRASKIKKTKRRAASAQSGLTIT